MKAVPEVLGDEMFAFLEVKMQWIFGGNFLVRKKAPRTKKYRALVGEGSNGHRTSPTLPSNLEKDVNVIGNFVFEFNLITYTSRVHLILFSNLICNHLRADGT